jgi:sugar phosphate isomerase/epimerase
MTSIQTYVIYSNQKLLLWPAVMRELRAAGYDDAVISEGDGDRETYAETRRRMEKILAL